jgi:hypothetical protein
MSDWAKAVETDKKVASKIKSKFFIVFFIPLPIDVSSAGSVTKFYASGANHLAILSNSSSLGVINIDGRDIELKLIKGNLPDKNFKVGRGGYQIWKGRKTTVRLDYIFTWLCPPKDEHCKVYYYKGTASQHRRKKL